MTVRPSGAAAAVVVLPTYNEAGNVGGLIDNLVVCSRPLDVLVVDDCSPDGTAEVVARRQDTYPGRVHLLVRPPKSGFGGAHRAGIEWALAAGYSAVVQMDADGSHPPVAVPDLLDALEDGADLVLGSRYTAGGAADPAWPLTRRALSKAANLYARTTLRLPWRDLTGGFRAWRAATLAAIDLDAADADGYAFLIQATVIAARSGARIAEVGYHFHDRASGESKMSFAIAIEAARATLALRHWQPATAVGAASVPSAA